MSIRKESADKNPFIYVRERNSEKIKNVSVLSSFQVGTRSNPSGLNVSGELSYNPTVVNYSSSNKNIYVDRRDSFVLLNRVDTIGKYYISVFLPKDPKEGKTITIKDFSSSFSNINAKILDGDGNELFVLSSSSSSVEFYRSGGKWEILSYSSGIVSGLSDDWVFVKTKYDLPKAVNGIHTLKDNVTYVFVTTVDLEGGRIVCGQNTTLLGGSSENCRLTSTGLTGEALVSSEWSLPIRNLTIQDVDIALDLDASGNSSAALDWFGVNFQNCNSCGTIANYSNFISSDCAWLSSGSLTFDGSFGTIGFSQCLFVPKENNSSIVVAPTCEITRRFRVIYSSFASFSNGSSGINFSTSAIIPDESYILDTVSFSGNQATIGVLNSDNKSRWANCSGVINTISVINMYVKENTVQTPIDVSGVNRFMRSDDDPLVTSASNIIQRFEFEPPSNAAGLESPPFVKYISSQSRVFKVQASISLTGSTNDIIGVYLARLPAGNSINPVTDVVDESEIYLTMSGSKPDSALVQSLILLDEGDRVYVVLRNNSSKSNVTVQRLNLIVEQAVS